MTKRERTDACLSVRVNSSGIAVTAMTAGGVDAQVLAAAIVRCTLVRVYENEVMRVCVCVCVEYAHIRDRSWVDARVDGASV